MVRVLSVAALALLVLALALAAHASDDTAKKIAETVTGQYWRLESRARRTGWCNFHAEASAGRSMTVSSAGRIRTFFVALRDCPLVDLPLFG